MPTEEQRERKRQYMRAYYQRNKDRQREADRRWREENPDKAKLAGKRWELRRRYGMTLEEYDLLVERQGGLCKACSRKQPLVVDHCHQTGRIRGLLCNDCNLAAGRLADSPRRCAQLERYLKESACGH